MKLHEFAGCLEQVVTLHPSFGAEGTIVFTHDVARVILQETEGTKAQVQVVWDEQGYPLAHLPLWNPERHGTIDLAKDPKTNANYVKGLLTGFLKEFRIMKKASKEAEGRFERVVSFARTMAKTSVGMRWFTGSTTTGASFITLQKGPNKMVLEVDSTGNLTISASELDWKMAKDIAKLFSD